MFREISRTTAAEEVRAQLLASIRSKELVPGDRLAIGALSVSLVGVAILGALLGGGFVFMHSTFQAWAVDLIPEARGTVLALFATSMFAGGSLATVIFGSLASDSRFSAIFAAAAIVCIPLGAAAALARRRYALACP